MKKQVLVVGSGGFIGSAISGALQNGQNTIYEASSSFEKSSVLLPTQIPMEKFLVGNLDDIKIDILIHCAGPRRTSGNTHETLMKLIIDRASNLGIKKIIYMSSVAAHFTLSYKDAGKIPIDKNLDYYGHDKLASENMLIDACENSTLNYLILRLPLVYGQNAKGKFNLLYNFAKFGLVLPDKPFNKALKSFLYIKNLSNLVKIIINTETCWNVSINVTDDDDHTAAQFSRKLAFVFSEKQRIREVSIIVIKLCLFIAGKSKVLEDLNRPARVDISKAKSLFKWRPKYNVDEAIMDIKINSQACSYKT